MRFVVRAGFLPLALPGLLGAVPRPATQSADALLESLRSGSPQARMTAACKLGSTKDPAVLSPLVETLQEPGLRVCAALSLGDLGDPRAIDPLMMAVDDPDQNFRDAVISALGAFPEARVLTRLVEILEDRHLESGTRSAAASALARSRHPSAVGPLVKALEVERDTTVRSFVAQAPGVFRGEPRAVDALIATLQSAREPAVRSAAARALGVLKEPRALDSLKAAEQDVDPAVRREASWAIERIARTAPDPR